VAGVNQVFHSQEHFQKRIAISLCTIYKALCSLLAIPLGFFYPNFHLKHLSLSFVEMQ